MDRILRIRERVTMTPAPGLAGHGELFNESYAQTVGEPLVIREAKAIANSLRKRAVVIHEDELIVGANAPTTVEPVDVDLSVLPPPQYYQPPSWPDEHKRALDAGLFALAGNHTTMDYETILRIGFRGLRGQVKERLERLTPEDREYDEKKDFLDALDIVAEAVIDFSNRYADRAGELARQETNPRRKVELQKIAENCRQVPAGPARSFYEAVQSIWSSFLIAPDAPGRVDQYLQPYYERDTAAGVITSDFCLELIKCLWLKIHELNGPTDPVSARHHVTLGGVKPDGADASNDVTYLCLQATEDLRILRPQVSLRWHTHTPPELLERAVKALRSGTGHPAFCSDETLVPGLCKIGIEEEDARNYSLSGCNEIIITGKSHMGSVEGFINLPKILEMTLGTDGFAFDAPRGAQPRGICDTETYQDFWRCLKDEMAKVADLVCDISEDLDEMRSRWPGGGLLQSLVTDGCIQNARGWTQGGARYNACNWDAVGLANLADSLMAIRTLVFDKNESCLADMAKVLRSNWKGHEELRLRILRDAPHYGNDHDEVDEIAARIVETFAKTLKKRTPYRGGEYNLGALAGGENMHIVFGKQTGATPDGRRKGEPLADTIGAAQGRDRSGVTSMLNSVAKLDHTLMPTSVTLNVKLDSKIISDDAGVEKIARLIHSHFASGGQQIQFNLIDRETLLAAKRNPENYQNLLVRVAGYSAPFVSLWPELQDEIIARTEHQA